MHDRLERICIYQAVVVVDAEVARNELVVDQVGSHHTIIGFAAATVAGEIPADPVPDQLGQRTERQIIDGLSVPLQARAPDAGNEDVVLLVINVGLY